MFSRVQPIAKSNPRKRQKRAHTSSDSEEGSSHPHPPPAPAMPFAPSPPHVATGGEQQTCQHEQTLKRLEPDLDSMRQLITCKVCQRFLSEPYGLACGHTYCYVCLDAWLVAQRKRTCPDCRATIKQQPVPSFLIREMTRVFAYRVELLPEGETVEEHAEYIKEASGKVSADKENGGLFSGLFKHGERLQWMPIRDPGDGVDRCPNCHWELEEGVCGACGLNIGDEDGFGLDTGESESSDNDDELDNDMVPRDYDGMDDPGSFDEDDFIDEHGENVYGSDHEELDLDAFGTLPIPAAALRRNWHRPDPINLDSEPESEDSEDPDNDPQMEGFLDNEEIEQSDSDSSGDQSDSEPEAEETPRHGRPRQIIRPMVIVDSDDDVPQQPRRPVVIESSDDDEEGPVARNSQRAGKVSRGTRRPQVHEISSSEGTSDDDNDNGNNVLNNAPIRVVDSDGDSVSESNSESDSGGVDAGGFSPMQSAAGDDSQADEAEGTYGAYGVYDFDAHDDNSDGEDIPDFAAEGGYGDYYDDPYAGEGTDGDDGGRNTRTETTPTTTNPPETVLTHRLLKRQQRRRRNADRDSGNSSLLAETSPQTPYQLGGTRTPTEADSQQERQQPARMRRVQGRDSLRSPVGAERRRRR